MRFHPCPGGCGTNVPQHHLACRPCWRRLPQALRDNVANTHPHRRASRLERVEHLQAMTEAIKWYRRNPLPSKEGP